MSDDVTTVDTISALLRSRKFLVLMFDTLVSTILYFGGKYLDPSVVDDVKFLIAALQPVAITLIYSIAKEDAARSQADTMAFMARMNEKPNQPQVLNEKLNA